MNTLIKIMKFHFNIHASQELKYLRLQKTKIGRLCDNKMNINITQAYIMSIVMSIVVNNHNIIVAMMLIM